ncbi:MAG: sulfur carrier protein ThiS adenylyltransferase ThiF [Spartobacteria bacterium]|nr:sulfur carrier protein ThiS adenylyltransferase ThiF [Spartobacteria bacterium]
MMQGGGGNVSSDYLELTARNPPALRDVVQCKCVGIAGCGGLGSNVAVMLARAGVGRLALVDDDAVALSNLNRQHFFRDDIGKRKVDALAAHLRRCNAELQLTLHAGRVTEENAARLFMPCDVVVEAFDGIGDKAMIIRAFGAPPLLGKPLVCASGLGGLHSANAIRTQSLTPTIFVCGDTTHDGCGHEGACAARVMVVAGHQALVTLRILCGMPAV